MTIDLLNTLYEFFYRRNFSIANRYNPVRVISNTLAKALRISIRKHIKNLCVPANHLLEGSNVIVSITTFPKRFTYLKYTLISILRQTVRPEKIIINLVQSECPNGFDDVPSDIIMMTELGVEFQFRDECLKPHGKYYYVMQNYPDKLIVTMDDDVFYRKDAIEKLLNMHQKFPSAVCGRMVRKIKIINGVVQPYITWSLYNNGPTEITYMAMGVGGVLYPACLFEESNLFNLDAIKKLCLNADDLWLKANELLLNIPVVTNKFESPDVTLESSKSNALSSDNILGDANDIQWKALSNQYNLEQYLLDSQPCNPKI